MDGVYFNELLQLYGELLTEKHRSVAEAYFGLDLSLGEIAEIRGVSRQSVSESLATTRSQLKEYESKLGLYAKRTALLAVFDRSENGTAEIAEIKKALGEF